MSNESVQRKKEIAGSHKTGSEYLFPIENIEKGSRILVYGLGVVATEFIIQIEILQWGKIVGISDDELCGFEWNYPFFDKNSLFENRKQWDYVLIGGISLWEIEEKQKQLISMGIDENTIISLEKRYKRIDKDFNGKSSREGLKFLLSITGGIGDGVMETAFCKKLVEMVPSIIIDVIGPSYLFPIFSHKDYVSEIYDTKNIIGVKYDEYDACFSLSWGVIFWNVNYLRIKRISSELYDKIRQTNECIRNNGNVLQSRLWEARLLHKDKFWLMGRGDIWNVSANDISLELDDSYANEFGDLALDKYITVNCGVDMRKITGPDDYPTKIWPKERFETFISMFKEEHPGYKVVQLGDEKQTKMEGVDTAVFGRSLELTKHILFNSTLHIDDEGGLVHMATALGTKCVVLFGPTPMDVLGYEQNINISANVCNECFCYVENWNARCFLETFPPRCMNCILPEYVLKQIDYYFAENNLEE